ncbi:MazG family protein [Synechococcus sp. PCC 7336]|uniref:MazG family protein n=1 Tax=Synechococcus sp. PCC 7336 TaxID=195250 RepID=UPI0003487D08|nr:MazG family protein [Synechococcus sp. PCC 7336]
MIQVRDCRTLLSNDPIPELGAFPILLTHCSLALWGQLFEQLRATYPAWHLVSPIDAKQHTSYDSIPLAEVGDRFPTLLASEPFCNLYLPPVAAGSLPALQQLIEVVAQLRSPAGCPWDRAQTPISLTPYILEEAYETVAAIRSGDIEHTIEELGDLLLQVVLQAQIFAEAEMFALADVAGGIAAKLIRRHPHVFGPEALSEIAVEEVRRRWEEIKTEEKQSETLADKVRSYADTFPPLLATSKIVKKTAGLEGVDGVLGSEQQLGDAIMAFEAAVKGDRELAQASLGEVLFLLVQLGHRHGLKATAALEGANAAAVRRVEAIEGVALGK